MNMEEFARKHIKAAKVAAAEWDNPLRIRRDGFHRSRDWQLYLIFKHREDGDLSAFFSASHSYEHEPNYIDGLRYLRRRMSYTHEALEAGDMIAVWTDGGIRARLRGLLYDEIEVFYKRHVSVYKLVRAFMGDAVFMEFLSAREGNDNDDENN